MTTFHMTESITNPVTAVFSHIGHKPALKHHWLEDFVCAVGCQSAHRMDSRAADWMAEFHPECDLLETGVAFINGYLYITFRVVEPEVVESTRYHVQLHRSMQMLAF